MVSRSTASSPASAHVSGDRRSSCYVAGRGGVAADAAAVALNVTVADPTGGGFVTVYPCGSHAAHCIEPQLRRRLDGAERGDRQGRRRRQGLPLRLERHRSSSSMSTATSRRPPPCTRSTRLGCSTPATGYTTIDGLPARLGHRRSCSITSVQIDNRVSVPADATAVVLNVTVTEAERRRLRHRVSVRHRCAHRLEHQLPRRLDRRQPGRVEDRCRRHRVHLQQLADPPRRRCRWLLPCTTSYQSLDPARLLDTRDGFSHDRRTVRRRRHSAGRQRSPS